MRGMKMDSHVSSGRVLKRMRLCEGLVLMLVSGIQLLQSHTATESGSQKTAPPCMRAIGSEARKKAWAVK